MKRHDELTELRGKAVPDLVLQLHAEERNLIELRFSLAFRKLKNLQEVRNLRKKIARIQTMIREKTEQQLAASGKES